jgi:FtsH-binding integral membrane protein
MADVIFNHVNSFFSTLDRKLDKDMRSHLKNVYGSLSLCVLAAAAGAYVHVATDILQGNFLVAIGSIITLLVLMSIPHSAQNEPKRFGLLMLFATCTGLSTGPLIEMALHMDPSIVVTAFTVTSAIFACFTLAALYAPDRKFLYLGGMLMSAMSTLFWMSLANVFFGSRMLFQVNLYVGLGFMCVFILYDTQLIMEKRKRGDDDYIWHAVDLFIDFVNVFRKILIVLMQKEQSKDKKRRN